MFALASTPAALSARTSAPLDRADARPASRSPAPAVRAGCRASSAIPPSDDARPGARARRRGVRRGRARHHPRGVRQAPPAYVADLVPTKGSDVAGSVKFETTLNKSNQEIVVITANIRGLSPGAHGFNIHENGDVTCDDASCTGASFNPQDRPHGAPDALKKFGASACHYVRGGVPPLETHRRLGQRRRERLGDRRRLVHGPVRHVEIWKGGEHRRPVGGGSRGRRRSRHRRGRRRRGSRPGVRHNQTRVRRATS